MRRPIKHDKTAVNKKSNSLKTNVSVHPFMMVAIAAALAVVVFLIVIYMVHYCFRTCCYQ